MKPAHRPWIPLVLIVAAAAHAEDNQSVGPLFPAPVARSQAAPAAPPPRLSETWGVAPLAVLAPAEKAARVELAALQAWNDAGRLPVRNGFARALPVPRAVTIDAGALSRTPMEHAGGILAETAFGRLAWGGEVRVPGAYRLRARLTGVRLPRGTRLWVHGDHGEVVGPFGLELRGPSGDLWTPSVGGESIRLDVELPAGAFAGGKAEEARFGFRIAEVLEMVPVEEEAVAGGKALPCEVDSACADRGELPFLDTYRHAVARLTFVNDGSGFLCSGALLNDTDSRTEIPYLLTAHHCLSTQEAAASLDAFWDYYRTPCGGTAPSLGQLPRSDGATLLATSNDTDFTLLRLDRVPPGRVFLGWTADASAVREDGTRLYRLSSPGGRPLAYSVTQVDRFFQACRDRIRPDFIYSTRVTGGTEGGSSGAPTILADGRVVGQLLGGCGDSDDCSLGQATVDGAFSSTFPRIRQFLAPLQPCTPGPNNLCLLGNRFRVELAWQNQYDGSSGQGKPVPRTDSTGFFYFQDPSNFELIVKILDFGDVVKVFYGQLTDLRFTLTVTDTRTGNSKVYQNGPNDCGAIDQTAFPGSLASTSAVFAASRQGRGTKAGTCVADADTLCLVDRRFAVEVDWRNQFNNESGKAQPAALSQQAGMFSYTDRSNIELVVKALDFGDRILFFWGALSDLEYTITLRDTETGATKTYNNPAGKFCGGLDNNAF